MENNLILLILIGFALGWALGFIIVKVNSKEARLKKEMEERDLLARKRLEAREQELKSDFQERLSEKDRAMREALAEKDRAMKEALAEKDRTSEAAMNVMQRRFDETLAKTTAQMQSATEKLLKERQEEFAKSSQTDIGNIVNPLRETMEKMQKTMQENKTSQDVMSDRLKTGIEQMVSQSLAAQKSADELTRAMKHGAKVQGDWGELILEKLLSSQGLVEGMNYAVQPTLKDEFGNVIKSEDGRSMRPDIILHMDKKRDVVIDSKVSLSAFINYVNADNEEDRRRYLKEHVSSLKKHVDELSKKDYSSYLSKSAGGSIDYVIMFVPHDGALMTALNQEPHLWQEAMNRNVLIAGEQTLYVVLKTIELNWRQIAQAENHKELYRLAGVMMDRVGTFMKHYNAVGKGLNDALQSYKEGQKKLAPNGASIIQTCRKLQEIGARPGPKNYLNSVLSGTSPEETVPDESLTEDDAPED